MRHSAVLAICAAALCVAITGHAYAACDDLVEDTTKVANRKIDVGKVTTAARALAGHGVTVRVRVYDTLKGKNNIGELADKIEKECGWTTNGKRQSNLYFIPFAVEKGDIAIRTGSAINARISETVATKAIATYMVPRWQAYKRDPNALAAGLVDILDSSKVVLAQPLSGGGPTTIVRHEATDVSGFATAFKWVAIGLVIIGIAVVVVFLYSRVSQERGEGQSAQAQARAVRQKCLNRLIAITKSDFIAEMEAMVDATKPGLSKADADELQRLFGTFKRQGEEASAAFNRFDSLDKDPNVNGLSPDAYRSNEQAYEDILASSIEPAEETLKVISKILNHAQPARVA